MLNKSRKTNKPMEVKKHGGRNRRPTLYHSRIDCGKRAVEGRKQEQREMSYETRQRSSELILAELAF